MGAMAALFEILERERQRDKREIWEAAKERDGAKKERRKPRENIFLFIIEILKFCNSNFDNY